MHHAYLGPTVDERGVARALSAKRDELDAAGVGPGRVHDEQQLCERVARHLDAGHVVGWMQGRMELGPRALGARSILGDPRRADMQEILNVKIKRRESFRPFAPAVLEPIVQGEWFDRTRPPVPFMSRVFPDSAPSATGAHSGGRARRRDRSAADRTDPATNPQIPPPDSSAFEARTGVPILLNTSFNENEPIVCSPEEALDCFLRTKMDVLVLGDRILERVALPVQETEEVPAALPAGASERSAVEGRGA